MKRKYLEDLGLEKELVDSIIAEHGKGVNEVKAKLTETQAEVTTLKESITNRDADIEKLKKEGGVNDELKTQLEELQGKYEADKVEYETQLVQTKKNAAIELALTNAKALNLKATKALLNADELELGDDGVKGLDEQLSAIKEANPFLFETEPTESTPPPKTPPIVTGGNPNGNTDGVAKSWKEKMNENIAKAKEVASKV